jgi:hypothetical protein
MTFRLGSVGGMFLRFISVVILALTTPLRVGELTASSPIVGLVEPSAQEGPARYGMERLREALAARGFRVASVSSRIRPDFVVVAGTTADCEAGRLLREANASVPTVPEALVIRRLRQYHDRPALVLYGSDARGLMYAALDVAEHVARASSESDPFQNVREAEERAFLTERGVSMYTMHRAYFESRLFDERYWQKYFDLLAASRINNFVVIFGYENGGFMAPPYPYFFDVDEFPGVKFVGLTAAEQERNRSAFKRMMQLAHERGIGVTAAIWDHIYRGGVQTGGIPGAPKGSDERVPGLVWGVTAENLAPYTKAALRRFLQVFPEVDAIQFRMHEESGLKKEEMVGFWHEVFSLIKQAKPDMRLDLRAKDLPDEVIEDALKQGLAARVSTKFWMEQMGLPFHPTHINLPNQKDRRHGYADLLRYPQRYRVHWQLWSGGTTRLLLWGDPDYVRRFAGAARLYGGTRFEINEMLATKMLGEPHTDKPVDILTPAARYYDYEFERYWHFYQLWGRLTYNPDTPSSVWEDEFTKRFGTEAGPHVMKAQHLASRVLPRIVAATYRYTYFPTTRGWAEMKRQDDLPTFAGLEGSDTQQFMTPRDAAKNVLSASESPMRWPRETSRWFAEISEAITSEVEQAERGAGERATKEFRSSVTDFRILAALARYYSWRLQAAVAYNLYKESGDLQAFDTALDKEKRAIEAWRAIVDAAAGVYNDKLPFGAPGHFPRHWREELQRLNADFESLVAARKTAPAKPDARSVASTRLPPDGPPPLAILSGAETARPGEDVDVTAKATSSARVKWVRLRYRHLTQYEDYQTADMTLDPETGTYKGRIPGSFVDPKWDLIYFVEVMDAEGRGRMYPDLEKETPYIVVGVQR